MSKKIVHLHLFKGRELNYDAFGNIKNENWVQKLVYGIHEYYLTLSLLKANGFCKAEIVRVTEVEIVDGKEVVTEIADISHYKAEFEEKTKHDTKKMTPQEKELHDLKEQMKKQEAIIAKLLNGSVKAEDINELDEAKKKYKEAFGKDPHHKKSLEQINNEINEYYKEN